MDRSNIANFILYALCFTKLDSLRYVARKFVALLITNLQK